ncbi:MAG: V-type ATPase subunit [Gemmiger sp.]|nr:V-type ATPase subunit [Gemmiger sp.]
MLPNKASNAVLAKARAMYGRRLTDEDYRTLAACRSMPELAGALKTMPLYAPVLVDINPVFARRAALETDLQKSIFLRYASLCRYDMSAGQSVYRYFILCSDMDEITACLRCLDSGHPGDYLYILPDFLQQHTPLDLYKLAKVTDVESFLKALAGTPYAAALAPLRGCDPARGVLAQADPILTKLRHQALVNLAGQGPNSENARCNPGVREYAQFECDTRAISNIARTKRMKMPVQAARNAAPLDFSALSAAEWERLLETPDLPAFKAELAGTSYGRQLQGLSYPALKEGMHKLQYQWCKKWLRFSTDPTLVMLCYVFLARTEIENLNHIIEGVHYGLPAEAILPLLTGYTEKAA